MAAMLISIGRLAAARAAGMWIRDYTMLRAPLVYRAALTTASTRPKAFLAEIRRHGRRARAAVIGEADFFSPSR